MSKLSNLVGKSQTFTIGEIELEIKPLNFEDMDLVMDLGDDAKKTEAMKKIVSKTLKESVPDATDEEINFISFKYFNDVTNAILKVNGLDNVTATT